MRSIALQLNTDKFFFYLISIFILTLPYNITNWWTGTFALILFLTTVFNPLRQKKFSTLFLDRYLQIIFIFIGFTYLSILWSESPNLINGDLHTNIDRFKYYFLFIPAIYLSNLSQNDLKKLLMFVAFAPTLTIIIYYTNALDLTNIYPTQDSNSYSMLRHYLIQNFFILFSTMYLYIHFFSTLTTNTKQALLYFVLLLITSYSLIIDTQTNSRLIDLAFLLVLTSVPLYFLSVKIKIPIVLLLLSIALLFVLNNSSIQKGVQTFTKALESDTYEGSWGHRTGYLLAGVEIYQEHPLIGRGINDITRPIENMVKEKPKYFIGEDQRHFHNEHINVLVAVGLTGYIILLYFFYRLYKIQIDDKNILIFKNTTILVMLALMMGEHYLSLKSTTNFFATLITIFIVYHNLETSRKKNT